MNNRAEKFTWNQESVTNLVHDHTAVHVVRVSSPSTAHEASINPHKYLGSRA